MEGLMYTKSYCGTTITCRYTLPDELLRPDYHDRLAREMERAVARVTLEHPLMQVGMVDGDTKTPLFVALDSIDLRNHIKWCVFERIGKSYGEAFQDCLSALLDAPWEYLDSRPAWNVMIFRPMDAPFIDVIFSWRHSIGDGTSGKLFHESLLRTLNKPRGTQPYLNLRHHILALEKQPRDYYPPPMEEMARFTMTKRHMAGFAWKLVKPGNKAPELHWAPIAPGPAVTVRRVIHTDARRMKALITACRAHETTITGLIHGITFVSFAQQLSAEQAPAFEAGTAVNLRPFMPKTAPKAPDRDLDANSIFGNVVTTAVHEFDQKMVADIRQQVKTEGREDVNAIATAIWSVAKHARGLVQKKLNEGITNLDQTLIKLIPDCRTEVEKWQQKPRTLLWELTNIGAIDAKPAGVEEPRYTIDRASFAVCAQTEQLVTLSPMSRKGGAMFMDVNWQEGTMDSAIGDKLAEDLQRWLDSVPLAA